MNTNNLTSDAQAIIDVAQRATVQQPFSINGVTHIFVPKGMELQSLERFSEVPRRITGKTKLLTEESFIEYYNRFCNPYSVIFCNHEPFSLTAIFDYHAAENDHYEARWCQFSATYAPIQTQEFKEWQAEDGRNMSQDEFSMFIEDHLGDIISPPAADMLEIATTLAAKTDINFRKAIRLDNGQVQFTYEENTESSAGVAGQLKVPLSFDIGIRLYEGGPLYQITARFRYRINNGKLSMYYDLMNLQKVINHAHESAFNKIKESMKCGNIYYGSTNT